MGKFLTNITNQVEIKFSIPLKLNNSVANKLINGHIKHTINDEINNVINIGCVSFGLIIFSKIE